MDLIQFERNLRGIDAWEILIPIIQKNIHQIERLNKEQLQKGLGSDNLMTGRHSKSPKSELYVDSKIARGVYNESIYPAVNLYDTGKFYAGIRAELDMSYGITIESTDFKAQGLEEAYGSHIYGLTPESLKQFCALLIDDFREALLKAISKE